MKKTSMMIGLTVLAIGAVVILPKNTLAYRGNPEVMGPNYSVERHESMITAFEENDYNAWKKLMIGRGRVTQIINKDNFARFAEAHRLALSGKTEEANAIRQQLGLGTGGRFGYNK